MKKMLIGFVALIGVLVLVVSMKTVISRENLLRSHWKSRLGPENGGLSGLNMAEAPFTLTHSRGKVSPFASCFLWR